MPLCATLGYVLLRLQRVLDTVFFLITYIQKIILIYWKVINTVSSLAYILSISLLSQHCEGLVFGSFHNLTFSRALVVDAAQVEYAVDNYSM